MSAETTLAGPAENIFRSPPLRFLGYANEVGEAFRPLVPPPFVISTYIIAGVYVLCDCGNIYKLASEGNAIKEDDEEVSEIELLPTHHSHKLESKIISPKIQSVDAIIWQSLASVMIPGITINLLVKLSSTTITNYFPPVPKPPSSSSSSSITSSTAKIPKKGHVIPLTLTNFFTRKSIPTAIGLFAIPFIIHPIDHCTDYLLDNSIRKFY